VTTAKRVYREVPPGHAACTTCDEIHPWLAQRTPKSPCLLYAHGPRGHRCPGSHQPGQPWLEATRLPTWDELSDVDKGAVLMFVWKCHWERSYAYARDNYPATYRDHPMLVDLDRATRCRYATAVIRARFGSYDGGRSVWPRPRPGGPQYMAERGLGDFEWQRLYDLAMAAEVRSAETKEA
jgi:hypothetical protein